MLIKGQRVGESNKLRGRVKVQHRPTQHATVLSKEHGRGQHLGSTGLEPVVIQQSPTDKRVHSCRSDNGTSTAA
jgi:hypothetical protein